MRELQVEGFEKLSKFTDCLSSIGYPFTKVSLFPLGSGTQRSKSDSSVDPSDPVDILRNESFLNAIRKIVLMLPGRHFEYFCDVKRCKGEVELYKNSTDCDYQ